MGFAFSAVEVSDGLQMAAREHVEELQARERRVWRVLQGAVLGVRLEGLLHGRDAVDHLGKLGERREDARGQPPRAVGDEGARVETLKKSLAGPKVRFSTGTKKSALPSKLSLRHQAPVENADCAPLTQRTKRTAMA